MIVRMSKRLPILLALLGVSLFLYAHRGKVQAYVARTEPGLREGQLAPDLPAELHALDGTAVRLGGLRGRVVLLHFWTCACGNCQHLTPSYNAWDRAYRDRGLSIIGVHTPELPSERDPQALLAAVKAHGITWPVVSDAGETAWDLYGVKAWPTAFVIDRAGVIRGTFVGDDSARDIEQLVGSLL